MAIPTSRTNQTAEIRISNEKCTHCGLCVSVCKDFSLEMENNKVIISSKPLFGCIGCGHCMAICPTGAIEIHGRTLSPEHIFTLPSAREEANYSQILNLYERRRIIREFQEKEVEADLVEKILAAARTAPMGLPPSDLNVLVLNSKLKIRTFASLTVS